MDSVPHIAVVDDHRDIRDLVGKYLYSTAIASVLPRLLKRRPQRGSGRDFITTMVAGYEVGVRVGMAVMPTHYRFWHSTATNETFAAAAAASSAS